MELDEALVERVSERVHDAWMETKRSQGVKSRPSEWGEEQMVPYDDLSERAKDLDRGTVRSVLSAVGRADDAQALAAISNWIDTSASYVGCDPEAVLWRRITKVSSEANEARDALEGMIGENPRKGVTHTAKDVIDELLDAAVAALAAVEHMTGNKGLSMDLLSRKIDYVTYRAGL